jgi:hypothetical protein
MTSVTGLILVASITCAGCTNPFQDDATLQQAPADPNKIYNRDSKYFTTWPGKPGLFKIKENLILQIPPQFHQFWLQQDWLGRSLVPRAPMPLDKLPDKAQVGFDMFMPDFSGYTPERYDQKQPVEKFPVEQVQIISISAAPMAYAEPGAPGSYPPNMFMRASTGEYRSFDPTKYETKYGLRCYDFKPVPRHLANIQWCYGVRDENADEYIMLETTPPPYDVWVTNPKIQAIYFTKAYGGLEITWRAHMNYLSRWHDIDQQIWKYIDAWNIAPKAAPIPSNIVTR